MNSQKKIDWESLVRLRSSFLGESPGESDYWKERNQLESYDLMFARRIGWKWDSVLGELQSFDWKPSEKPWLIDWGCGTGIAARRFLAAFGATSVQGVKLWDKSSLAMEVATEKLSSEAPYTAISPLAGATSAPAPFLLLLSHVLNELSEENLVELFRLMSAASAILWVEPGTPSLSRKLIEIRENLRGEFSILAPCPHQERCGLLALEASRHWCHHFAEPPDEIFQTPEWAEFSRKLGVDLRSLPTSYLVLQKSQKPTEHPPRMIGRPRLHSGHAEILICEKSGVKERTITRSKDKELLKALKSSKFSRFLS